jgi:hypothetical protein
MRVCRPFYDAPRADNQPARCLAAHVSECGRHLAILLSDNRVVLVQGWARLCKGKKMREIATSIVLGTFQADASVYLAYTGGRVGVISVCALLPLSSQPTRSLLAERRHLRHHARAERARVAPAAHALARARARAHARIPGTRAHERGGLPGRAQAARGKLPAAHARGRVLPLGGPALPRAGRAGRGGAGRVRRARDAHARGGRCVARTRRRGERER